MAGEGINGSGSAPARSKIPPEVLDAIKTRVSMIELVGRSIKLARVKTGEKKGLCPFHAEKTPSFHVYSDHYHCFGCGAHGDAIDYVVKNHGRPWAEAVEVLKVEAGLAEGDPLAAAKPRQQPAKKAEKREEWEPIMPVPEIAGPPPTRHPEHGEPEHVARLLALDGELLHLIYRFPPTESRPRKMVVPLCFGRKDGKLGWFWKGPQPPRPLYGLDQVAALPQAPVLVVEGEVKRDAAQRLLGNRAAVISWPNGSTGVGKADWSPLSGRHVVIWPDADPPGAAAAVAIVNVLRGIVASARALEPPEGVPKGWDLADAEKEGWDGERVARHAWPPEPEQEPPPQEGPPEGLGPDADGDAWPFLCLGFDRDRFFFLPHGAPRVLSMSSRDLHNDGELVKLARRRWWEGAFPGRQSFDAKAAGDDLIRKCERAGVYDPDRIRGRGVWLDGNRVLLHLGDRMLIDGRETPPGSIGGRWIYEVGRQMQVEIGDPATKKEASALLRLCCEVAWEDPDRDGRLLAGWLVVAMACGGMVWRPHLWISGEAGSGKSWVWREIVAPVLSGLALRVKGRTREAGIRAALGFDARPVIFAEAETQGDDDARRIQEVLGLARAASDEDDDDIVQGKAGGGGIEKFRIRSCFAFSAVNVPLAQRADETRMVLLTLRGERKGPESAAQFDALEKLHREVMTHDLPGKLLARTMRLLPVIRANSKMLAAALTRSGVSRRTGDTLGVVLAGAYSLTSDAALDAKTADEWIANRAWVGETAEARESSPEWHRALLRLLQHELRLTAGNGRPVQATLGELIEAAGAPLSGTENVLSLEASDGALRRGGIRLIDGNLCIGNQSQLAAQAFAGSPWAAAWRHTLARAPGARSGQVIRFTRNMLDRAVLVPLDVIEPEA